MTLTLDRPSRPIARRLMRAATVTAAGTAELREVEIPEPGPGEVRVRLEGCGVCASNIPPWEGRPWFSYPMPPGQLGHEGWGTIDALGDGVTRLAVGDRAGFLSERAYAEFDVTSEDRVVRIPADLAGVPFPAEPLGCAMNIFARSCISAGQTVAIVGFGFLGALLTQLATRAGATVLAIGRRPFALESARQCGAAHAIPLDEHHAIIRRVSDLTGGRFCDVVIEVTGKEWPLNLSGELTRERGRLVIAGYHQDGMRSVNVQLWNWRGLDVINAHERETSVYVDGMSRAIKAVRDGRMDPQPLFTHRYSLEQFGDALNAARDRPDGFMKALIVM